MTTAPQMNSTKRRRLMPRPSIQLESDALLNRSKSKNMAGQSLKQADTEQSSTIEPCTQLLSSGQLKRIAPRKSLSKPVPEDLHIDLKCSSSSLSTALLWNKENNRLSSELSALQSSGARKHDNLRWSPGRNQTNVSLNSYASLDEPSSANHVDRSRFEPILKIHTPQPRTPISLGDLGLLADSVKDDSYFAIDLEKGITEASSWYTLQSPLSLERSASVPVPSINQILQPTPVASQVYPDCFPIHTSLGTKDFGDLAETTDYTCLSLHSTCNSTEAMAAKSTCENDDYLSGNSTLLRRT